ncbi:hypothetical protein C6P46_005647 [Rhodotorula mucilaginosa]|uniref:Secreted protein n=1 Tax=Rhodotorula mucilaginosa TaxID=5537 RepID=A0A9P7B4X9_RHOMI|nr:hypothetical protein C6P46_005647 [Rhodotorula mucilaginosa]
MSPPLSSPFAFATTFTLTLFLTLLASLSLVPVVHGQAAGLGLVQCAPAQVQVGGGSGPYTVSVLPAGADGQIVTGAEPLQTFPALNQSGVASWLVNVPSGTTVRLGVRDGTGAVSYSDPFTVQSGSSNDWFVLHVPQAGQTRKTLTCERVPSPPNKKPAPVVRLVRRPNFNATFASSFSSVLSSSPFSSASSQPESSASRSNSLTATTGRSSSASVLPSSSSFISSSSSLLPFSSLTGSVTTQLVVCIAVDDDDHPPIDLLVDDVQHAYFLIEHDQLGERNRSVRDEPTEQWRFEFAHAIQLTTWLLAALLLVANA